MEKEGNRKKKKRLTIRDILEREIEKIPGMTQNEKWRLIQQGAANANRRFKTLKSPTGISFK